MNLAYIKINPHSLVRLLKDGKYTTNLPKDVQYYQSGCDRFGDFFIQLSSESFPKVENNSPIPQFDLQITNEP